MRQVGCYSYFFQVISFLPSYVLALQSSMTSRERKTKDLDRFLLLQVSYEHLRKFYTRDKICLFVQSTSLKSEEQLRAVVEPCLSFLKELEGKEKSSNITINFMSIRS